MLDEFRSTNITWDKATSRIYSPVTANASDENGRKLVVQIVNSGQVEDLTGAALHLYWETRDKLRDGLDVFKAVDLEKGEFELSYTTGMLSNKGVLNANLVLIDTVGRVVSERFKITVTEGIDNDAIQSENSFSSLTQALIDVSNLEQNYAPRLNDLTAQLAQTDTSLNSRIDNIIATPTTVSEQEIMDARAGKDSLGANLRDIRESSENVLEDKRTFEKKLFKFEIDADGIMNFVITDKPITLDDVMYEGLTLRQMFNNDLMDSVPFVNANNATNFQTIDGVLTFNKLTDTTNFAYIRQSFVPPVNVYAHVTFRSTSPSLYRFRLASDFDWVLRTGNIPSEWTEVSYTGQGATASSDRVRYEFLDGGLVPVEYAIDLNKSIVMSTDVFDEKPSKEQLDKWFALYVNLKEAELNG